MNFIEIIEQQDEHVVIKISTELFSMLNSMVSSQETTEVAGVSQDFLRRVVPFFMNQFLNWTKQSHDDTLIIVSNSLQRFRENKKSNQKKFELGDLKKIYNPKDFRKFRLLREAWETFLFSKHIRDCIQQNQRVKAGSKINYQEAIKILIDELSRPFPYNKLLSKYKLGNSNRIPAQQIPFENDINQGMQQVDENSTCYLMLRPY